MDDVRIGLILRALRRRLGLRQRDVASRAKVSQSTVSRLERGHMRSLSVGGVRDVLRIVDARYEGIVLWRGGAIDALLDEGHAALVSAVLRELTLASWQATAEVTYSVYGERGSIDVLGFDEARRAVLVAEIKTEIASQEATIRKHDEKVRLIAGISRERFGWVPTSVARVLVLPESARRSMGRWEGTFRPVYPGGARQIRAWLQDPSGTLGAIWFLAPMHPRTINRRRVRPPTKSRRPASVDPPVLGRPIRR